MQLLVIILIIIVLMYLVRIRHRKYSWEDFSNKFGNHVGEFGVYNLDKDTEESTYPDRKITGSYDTIFKSQKVGNTTYMLKIAESNATGAELDILNYVKPITDKYDHDNVIIRIQTNPWRCAPHFDAMNQLAYMLSGTKKWILWNVEFEDYKETLKFRDDINNLNFEQLQSYLTKRGISYETKVMKPYDTLYIKYGTWHYVENDNTTKGSIMLNIYLKNVSVKFDEDFMHLWPTQYKRCRNNQFY
jgi:hypothetical protein